ncbi:MAG: PDZ domain-containing protein [Bacteroidota bacterium]
MQRIYLLIYTSFLLLSLSAQGTQLLRQPTISADHICFVYANDLWIVERDGQQARRLTTHEGPEANPHFSADGSMIAFSAYYEGNFDVYVVPTSGGDPQRLTYHPSGDWVQGWTAAGDVMFRSGRKSHPTVTNRLYAVSLEGGLPQVLPPPRAAYGEMSPDGRYLAYTPITGWDPEWRNYRGGQAMPIWIQDLRTNELIRTPQPTQERHMQPVWYGNEVLFISERDYLANIWAFNPRNQEIRQLTFHKDFDIKSLDPGPDGVVYEQGGYLHLLDPATGDTKQLTIEVRGDMNFARNRWEDVSAQQLGDPAISPSGKRALFEYRGEIFSVPKADGEGDWRNLTNSPGVADRYPAWSPEGDRIAWFSDESGEYQIVVSDQLGENQRKYNLPNSTFYFRPDWSSDGRFLSFTDTDYNIWIVDITGESGARMVDTDRYAHPNRSMNPVWSPDGQWITYAKQLDSHFKAIFAYNVNTDQRIQLTDGMADAISPVWDASGKYLYFLASTNYGLNSGWLDMSSYDPDVRRNLYMIILQEDGASPFLPEAGDESADEEEDEEKTDSDTTLIHLEGLQQRILPIDIPAGNYQALVAAPKHQLFYLEAVSGSPGVTIHKYDLDEQESKEFLSGARQAISSADRKQMLVRTGSGWSIVGTSSPAKPNDHRLESGLRIQLDPSAEYAQIFREAWRYMRDFLYVENIHGAPWDDIWEWYSPWLEDVKHRTDLNYLLDILSGEVAVGHSYVSGGDMPDLDRVATGLLGADWTVENGRYRLTKIYTGESWNPNLQGPLAIPGIGAEAGDYLLAVNGRELTAADNIYALFAETVGRQTRLRLSANADGSNSRLITVVPIASESGLRTFDWIEGNRRRVDELSNGELAYVYVPNTGGGGFTSFNRYYFAQQDRKGVVIDERNNGGGSAADYMIDIMNRQLFGYFNSAAGDRRPWTTPIAGIWGPKVMIINERAGSGGDLLPYMFRAAEIGPLVGTRTWGGLVGTWDTPRFIDGGRFVAPRGGFYDVDGEWAVEGEGIAPDIEVIQEPKIVMQGRDPQLEAAVEEALRLLAIERFEMKPEPPGPVRSRRPE